MARFSISLLIFGILGSAYGQEFDYTCARLAHKKCVNPSTEEALNRLNSFPNESFLKENCDAIIEGLDCLLEEEKTCPLSLIFMGPKNRFRGLLGIKKLVEDMCDEDSSLRKDYINIVGCLVEHDDDFEEDVREIERIISKLYHHPEVEEMGIAEETLQCVAFSLHSSEFKNSVEKYCGALAEKTVDTILNYVLIMETDHCLEDQENIERLTELLQSIRSSRGNLI